MLLFWLLTASAIFLCALSVRLRFPYEGLYSTSFLFCLGAFIYFMSIPIEHFSTGIQITSDYVDVEAGSAVYLKVFLIGLASVLAFTIGMNVSGFKSRVPDKEHIDKGRGVKVFESALWILWAVLIGIIAVFYHGFIAEIRQSYTASYTAQYANPLPTLICQIVALINAILMVFLGMRKSALPIFIAVCLFAFNIYLTFLFNEKSPGAIALIGVGYLYFFWVRDKRLAIAGALVGVLMALFVLKPLYNILSENIPTQDSVFTQLAHMRPSFTVLDSAGPMAATLYLLDKDEAQTYGMGLLKSVGLLVPRALWPERPMDPSEVFAQKMMVGWQPGMGMGYSPIIEAYMNFGLWLSFLEFLIFGLLWGWMWRGFMRVFAFYNTPAHLDVIYRIAGFYVLILFFRGMMIGGFKQALMYIVPFSIALGGMQILIYLWDKWQVRKRLVLS